MAGPEELRSTGATPVADAHFTIEILGVHACEFIPRCNRRASKLHPRTVSSFRSRKMEKNKSLLITRRERYSLPLSVKFAHTIKKKEKKGKRRIIKRGFPYGWDWSYEHTSSSRSQRSYRKSLDIIIKKSWSNYPHPELLST